MKLFITGGTGYLGSQLINKINKTHTIALMVRSNSKIEDVKLKHPEISLFEYTEEASQLKSFFTKFSPDIVIHLAASSIINPTIDSVDEMNKSNILLPMQLLLAMKETGITRFINTGTRWQHYNNEKYNPNSLYAATKQAAEDIARYFFEAHQFSIITLALSDIYGPNDPRKKLIPLLFEAALKKETLDMSPGEQLNNPIFIDDVINAYLVAIERISSSITPRFEHYRISANATVTLKELVFTFNQVTNLNLSVNWGKLPYREREIFTEWTTGETLPGWNPIINLPTGLKKINESIAQIDNGRV